jgi:hypothetical protein
VSHKLWEQIELEDALHWLSTLGGAYSNLGERSLDFVSQKKFQVEFLKQPTFIRIETYIYFFYRLRKLVVMLSSK